ncbi:hypothetical protein SJPD1_1276 [Sulfurospirillum diekertiae]|uniref:Uncharacterized protein n=1 Tax=Sulfurospirillum diekertiae TaxID=1854492 RepID=A0A290HU79_9BACT|nr:hypothetical protein [Sulfurospirillum diekertiae]ATB69386.1 hypothetical protein SJPD1_1276 [Sulfurospirillum diekertiae]
MKGLTTDGIVCQIISALKTYKLQQYCISTINDCQVVLNHLIRKYSEPLKRESKRPMYCSKNLQEGVKKIREHVIPVKVVMEYLLSLKIDEEGSMKDTIKTYLDSNLIIVDLTDEEDKKLIIEYKDSMPKAYAEPTSEYYQDIWCRYKLAGIYDNIQECNKI